MMTAQAYPFPTDAHDVEGMFYIPNKQRKSRRFSFKKIPLPPLPERIPLEGKIIHEHSGHNGNGKVYLNNSIYTLFTKDLPLSSHVEDGGYIIGQAFRCPGSPSDENDLEFKWWISIDHIIPAKGIFGTPGMLLFTGDSWSHIHRALDNQYKGLKLLGWYHTHLFDATPEMGLSMMDMDLHSRFLPLPWQVALLINIHQNNDRYLRCFQKTPQNVFLNTPYYDLDTSL
ncbi:hypothetical protein MHK_008047 [Candidatus Magnetomorum sp. HK-1]|nr:hypothetical protein MHK_008047 [Candidatus Magnetomorum sp. HK-1]